VSGSLSSKSYCGQSFLFTPKLPLNLLVVCTSLIIEGKPSRINTLPLRCATSEKLLTGRSNLRSLLRFITTTEEVFSLLIHSLLSKYLTRYTSAPQFDPLVSLCFSQVNSKQLHRLFRFSRSSKPNFQDNASLQGAPLQEQGFEYFTNDKEAA